MMLYIIPFFALLISTAGELVARMRRPPKKQEKAAVKTVVKPAGVSTGKVSKKRKNKKQKKQEISVVEAPATPAEEKACALFECFVDLKNTTLSWKSFANEVADVFESEEKYVKLGKVFRGLASSTTPWYIGYKLRPHKNLFPPRVLKVLEKFAANQSELLDIIDARIKLNLPETSPSTVTNS